MAKIELLESWAGVVAPLRALIAEVEHDVHADGTASPDLATVSARWAQVRDAIRGAAPAVRLFYGKDHRAALATA